MSNEELAKKIAADLFTPGNSSGSDAVKAKQLRLYSEFNPHGWYISGWGESEMANRIEQLLNSAGFSLTDKCADGND